MTRDGGAEATLLGSSELLAVIDLVQLATIGPPLLQAKLIRSG